MDKLVFFSVFINLMFLLLDDREQNIIIVYVSVCVCVCVRERERERERERVSICLRAVLPVDFFAAFDANRIRKEAASGVRPHALISAAPQQQQQQQQRFTQSLPFWIEPRWTPLSPRTRVHVDSVPTVSGLNQSRKDSVHGLIDSVPTLRYANTMIIICR